jgi:adenylate cyclase
LLSADAALMPRIAAAMDQALLRQGTLALHESALPNIPSYSLMLRAVQALHRLRPETMAEAQTMLEHLAERHPRSSDVQAWLAKCHFVHLHQLRPSDPQACADQLRQAAQRALELDPQQGVALALRGQLQAFHELKLEAAHDALAEAVSRAPNEPLAWTYLCNAQALLGDPRALNSHAQAQALAPLDPLGYELDMMGSIAHGALGSPIEALRLARRSVQRNPVHLSGLVQLIISLVRADQMEEARQTAAAYMQLRPRASVQRFIDLHVGGQRPIVREQADALLAAGLPL